MLCSMAQLTRLWLGHVALRKCTGGGGCAYRDLYKFAAYFVKHALVSMTVKYCKVQYSSHQCPYIYTLPREEFGTINQGVAQGG